MPKDRVIVVNNSAAFGWAFMTIWMAMLCTFSWLALRGGGVPGHSAAFAALVFGVFWVAGVAISAHMLNAPLIRAVAQPSGVTIEEIWLWKRRRTSLGRGDAQRLRVVDDKDDDGDPYFKCEARLPDRSVLILKESHARAVVEAAHHSLVESIRS